MIWMYPDDPANPFRPRTDGLQTCLVPNEYAGVALMTWFPAEEECPTSLQEYTARKAVDDGEKE